MIKLLEIATQRFVENNCKQLPFSDNEESNIFLNDLVHYPHAYVLACLLERQIKSEKAWEIPYRICGLLGTCEMKELA